jgi:hypothetical protein
MMGTSEPLRVRLAKPIFVSTYKEVPMFRKSASSLSLATALLAIVCALLFNPTAAVASGGSMRCSNETLTGAYGFNVEGVLLGVPNLPPEAQFRSTGVARLDGKGNATWVEHTVVHGMPLQQGWVAATASYRVNSNCTGLLIAVTPNSPAPLYLYFVIVKRGDEFRSVLNSDAIAATFTRVDAE